MEEYDSDVSAGDFELMDKDDEFYVSVLSKRHEDLTAAGVKPKNARFQTYTTAELNDFKTENQSAKSTKEKTKSNMKLFTKFLEQAKNEDRPIQDIPPKKLDQLVGEFIVCVRKEKPDERGSYEYEPSYLRGIIASIERYLKEYNYPCSLTRDKQFTYTQSMLAAKQRDLKKQGKGNKPCKSDHLLPTEVEKMWQTGALGTQNPQSLQYTLWWYLMTEAGMRASREHLSLCWGDVKLKTTTDGKRYIEHMERQTKMRMGEGAATKQTASKIFENASDPSRCPVQAYLKFEEKRPEAMKTDDARFYLQALNKPVNRHLV